MQAAIATSAIIRLRFELIEPTLDYTFTRETYHALARARYHAEALASRSVGTTHLILALCDLLVSHQEASSSQLLRTSIVEPTVLRTAVLEEHVLPRTSGVTRPPFSHRLRLTIARSIQIALDMNADSVGSHHLLLGLLWEGSDPVLERFGIDWDSIYGAARMHISREKSAPRLDEPARLTAGATLAIHVARVLAEQCKSEKVGTQHLLLALATDNDGIAKKVLDGAEIGYEELVERIDRVSDANTSDSSHYGPLKYALEE